MQFTRMRTEQIPVAASHGQTWATIIRVLNIEYIAALLLVLTRVWQCVFQEDNRGAISPTLMRLSSIIFLMNDKLQKRDK